MYMYRTYYICNGVRCHVLLTEKLCTLLKRVKDACAEDDIQQDTEASMEKYAGKNEVKTAALLLSTTETGKAVKQQTDQVTVHPVSSASHTGTFLQDLPPLALFANKQQGTSREEISLDDLLGPLVEEQRLDKHAGTVQDETAPCGREPMHDGPVTISPPEFEYPDEFSSDQESAEDKSLSFNMQLSTNGGGRESMQESETEQHQLHSLSLHIPAIVTGDNSEASGKDGQDLNKVSEEVLAQEKKKMDLLFETHHIKPGATDWEYDKQKEFEVPCMESGWDSESSSVQEF